MLKLLRTICGRSGVSSEARLAPANHGAHGHRRDMVRNHAGDHCCARNHRVVDARGLWRQLGNCRQYDNQDNDG